MRHITLRPARMDDLPAFTEISNRAVQALVGTDEISLAEYQNNWQAPFFDPAIHARVALLDGQIVGIAEVWCLEPFIKAWLHARVDPAFRGLGVGTALMEWAEAQASQQLQAAPEGARTALQSATFDLDTQGIALLTERGFQHIRRFLTMMRPLDQPIAAPTLPEGISIRSLQPGDERAAFATYHESFRDHWGHVSVSEEAAWGKFEAQLLKHPDFDPSLWFLAWDGDEVAGIAFCRQHTVDDPQRGWVDRLAVRRPWRQRGLGEALLLTVFAELQRRGQLRAGLGVDSGSLTGATRLYERVGMHAIERYDSFEKVVRDGADLSLQTL